MSTTTSNLLFRSRSLWTMAVANNGRRKYYSIAKSASSSYSSAAAAAAAAVVGLEHLSQPVIRCSASPSRKKTGLDRGGRWNGPSCSHAPWQKPSSSSFFFLQQGRYPTPTPAYCHYFSTTSSTSTSTATNTIPFLLADIGEGIHEVELLNWYVEVGDTVQQFDAICQVQSDKATVDITSRYDGVVTQLAGKVGDMIHVGKPLLFLSTTTSTTGTATTTEDSLNTTTAQAAAGDPVQDTTTTTTTVTAVTATTVTATSKVPETDSSSDEEYEDTESSSLPQSQVVLSSSSVTLGDDSTKIQMSPAVRRLCKDYNIDPATVTATGPHGRLLKSDVLAYIDRIPKTATTTIELTESKPNILIPPQQPPPTVSPAASSSSSSSSLLPTTNDNVDDDDDTIVPLRGYSRIMAKTMTESLQIPHMCLGDELDVTKLLKVRQQINASSSSSSSSSIETKVSLLAFLIKACSMALTEYPILNAAAHTPDSIRMQSHHHLGIAMDTPRGLAVPVIANCEQLSIVEIQQALNHLKSTRDHLVIDTPPTFTLSNIGALGAGLQLKPVLVPPQLAMGAIGRLQRLPRFASTTSGGDGDNNNDNGDNGMVVVAASILPITWAGDHRYLDGATLARFHVRVQQLLQDPWHMMVRMK